MRAEDAMRVVVITGEEPADLGRLEAGECDVGGSRSAHQPLG
jgi:hypothetical protein